MYILSIGLLSILLKVHTFVLTFDYPQKLKGHFYTFFAS